MASQYDKIKQDYSTIPIDKNQKLQEYNDKTNEALNEATSNLGLPPCSINFGNLGNINFNFLDVKKSEISMRVFDKVETIDKDMRVLNNLFIQLITNFNCCSLGEKYNGNIRDPLHSVTEEVCTTLIKLAEQSANSYVVFKAYYCAIKPVPGNPWLKTAGYDFLKPIYSFLNGFEAFYDWVMDGTILNVLIDPLENIIKKIQSCTPIIGEDQPEYDIYLKESQDKINNALKSLDAYVNYDPQALNKHYEKEVSTSERIEFNNTKFNIQKEINSLEVYYRMNLDTLAFYYSLYSEMSGLNNTMTQEDEDKIKKINEEQIEYLKKIKVKVIELQKINDKENSSAIPGDAKFDLKKIDDMMNDYYFGEDSLNKMIMLRNKVSCTCLLTILGVTFNPPEKVEISTQDDFDKLLVDRVLYKNKDAWKKLLDDIDKHNKIVFKELLIKNKSDVKNEPFDQNIINNLERVVAYGGSISDKDFFMVEPTINDKIINLNNVDYNTIIYDVIKDEKNIFNNTIINRSVLDKNKFKTVLLEDDEKQLFAPMVKGTETIDQVVTINTNRNDLIRKLKKSKIEAEISLNKELDELRGIYNVIYNELLVKSNKLFIGETLGEKVTSTVSSFDSKAIISSLGTYFEPVRFILFLQTKSDEIDGAEFAYASYISTYNDSKYYKLKFIVNAYEGAISKLEQLLKYDHICFDVIASNFDFACGCDILCKLIQWVVDIIVSAINALIKATISRLIQSIMNEKIAYIIKFILEKYQCFLDIKDIPIKLDTIKTRTQSLIETFEKDFESAPVLVCDQLKQKDVSEILSQSEYPYELDIAIPNGVKYVLPMKNFGDISESNIIENKVIVADGMSKNISGQISNANIPTITYDCNDVHYPYIALSTPSLKDSNSYDMNLIFKIGNIIDNAIVTENIKNIPTDVLDEVKLDTGEVVNIPSLVSITNLTETLKNIQSKVEELNNSKIFVENNCNTTESYLEFCSINNLNISELNFANHSSTGILETNQNTIYGSLTSKIVEEDNFKCYFPEHVDADKNGEVSLLKGKTYFEYKFKAYEKIIKPDTITIETIQSTYKEVVEYDNVVEKVVSPGTDGIKYIQIDNQEITYDYKDWVKDVDSETMGTLTKTTTIKHNIKKYFIKPNMEFIGKFVNSVNYLNIRCIFNLELDAEGEYDFSENYYTGRYPEYIVLGTFGSKSNLYSGVNNDELIISIPRDRLLLLSKNILKTNFMLAKSLSEEIKEQSVSNEVKKESETLCLIPDDQKQMLENIKLANNIISDDLNKLIDEADKITEASNYNIIIPESGILTNIPVELLKDVSKRSIMFLMLNEEKEIAIQIIDKKLQLHLPSNTYVKGADITIDHELVPGNVYNFTFSIQGNLITIKLLNESKEEFKATILNMFGYKLMPSYIGGLPQGFMPEGMHYACTLQIMNLVYSVKDKGYDFYKNSLLNTKPETSIVNFDYSIMDINNRIYNNTTTSNINITPSSTNKLSSANNVLFLLGLDKDKQKISGYGEVIKNDFFQVYKGMLDNFFCSNNLNGLSFTLSVWFYIDKKLSNLERHVIISDDINNNVVFYNSKTNQIVIKFGTVTKYISNMNDEWNCIFIEKVNYEKKYRIILTSKNFNQRVEEIMETPINFNLMSIGSEFYPGLGYINLFEGLFGPITVYVEQSTDAEKLKTCANQYIQIKGLEKVLL